MKKKLTLFLAAVMIITLVVASLSLNASATEAPLFFWDFKESFPESWNKSDFFPDGNIAYSEDGNMILAAKDGDGATNHIITFINTESTDQGEASMKKCSTIAVRFKVSRTEVTAYNANTGLIGYDGQEKYQKPTYEETDGYQTWYLDFSGDWSKDAYYFVWYWHEAANFWQNVEIEFIGGFTDEATAKAYVAAYDAPPVTEAPETDAPATDAPETDAPSQPDNPDTANVSVIATVVAAIVAILSAVYFCRKSKAHKV